MNAIWYVSLMTVGVGFLSGRGGVYFIVGGFLFVLSTASYMVDFIGFESYLRWTLILLFMFLKAGLIMSIFMHMAGERMALMTAILLPPIALLFLIAFMAIEGDHIFVIREIVYSVINFEPSFPH